MIDFKKKKKTTHFPKVSRAVVFFRMDFKGRMLGSMRGNPDRFKHSVMSAGELVNLVASGYFLRLCRLVMYNQRSRVIKILLAWDPARPIYRLVSVVPLDVISVGVRVYELYPDIDHID